MKITTFDTVIISRKADDIISLYEELGFARAHTRILDPDSPSSMDFYRDLGYDIDPSGSITIAIMKDADGHNVEVADAKDIPQDMVHIRMNVDDFEEAYNTLVAHGFRNTRGDTQLEVKKAKGAMMVSPSGLRILIIKHISCIQLVPIDITNCDIDL